MANITRIKASDTRKRHDLDDVAEAEVVTKVKAATKAKAEAKTTAEPKKQVAEKSASQEAAEQATQKAGVAKNDRQKSSNNQKTNQKADKKASKKHKTPKFIRVVTKPFRAFGRYLRDSWGELRQVRWPSRKATWKLTLAVIVYCGILIAIIMGLDLLFTELFGWILG